MLARTSTTKIVSGNQYVTWFHASCEIRAKCLETMTGEIPWVSIAKMAARDDYIGVDIIAEQVNVAFKNRFRHKLAGSVIVPVRALAAAT